MNDTIEIGLRKFVAPEYIFGVDARLMAGNYCKKLGAKKVFLATDKGIINTSWFNELKLSLDENQVNYFIFSDISPNPRDFEVMNGANEFKDQQCNIILAIGGGSVIDCAKGIGVISTNNKEINLYEGVDEISIPIPPLICIPTTGGSSADVSQFAIINNTKEKYKMALISKALVPDIALIDPFVLTTMDDYLTACTGMDTLSHAIEAFVSNANSSFTDLYSIEAIKLISSNLENSITNPNDIQSRGKVMLASLYAGLAFSNASLGCVHSLAHSLGGYLDLAHGECNAILLPHVVDYNYNSTISRYNKVAELMGLNISGLSNTEIKNKLILHLIDFKQNLDISDTLKHKGVKKDIISTLASKAINDPCNATNPKPPSKKDLEVIYSEAF